MFVRNSSTDIVLLFSTRILRLFCYGFLSVILVLYLVEKGLSESQAGLLFAFTLAGDAVISLWLTTSADRSGRKLVLVIGSLLMVFGGVCFLLTDHLALLAIAALIGVISPGGGEIGPFLSVEQAALSQLTPGDQRTFTFARYTLAGSLATAVGALCGGWLVQALKTIGWAPYDAYRLLVALYAAGGLALAVLFLYLSPAVEVKTIEKTRGTMGLHRSRGIVLKLSALFALDAMAGGFIIQSFMAYWFAKKFALDAGVLGSIFFSANLLAGFSALVAARLARRFGLIHTMVFTHIPSNILLLLVPIMPTLGLATLALLLRFAISQMDVPARQSYTMAVVDPDERSAAAGLTGIARSLGAALSPGLTGVLLGLPGGFNLPFYLAGGLKLAYDLALYRSFRKIRPPEETRGLNS